MQRFRKYEQLLHVTVGDYLKHKLSWGPLRSSLLLLRLWRGVLLILVICFNNRVHTLLWRLSGLSSFQFSCGEMQCCIVHCLCFTILKKCKSISLLLTHLQFRWGNKCCLVYLNMTTLLLLILNVSIIKITLLIFWSWLSSAAQWLGNGGKKNVFLSFSFAVYISDQQ